MGGCRELAWTHSLSEINRDIPHDKLLVDSQLTAQLPDLVLEQLTQGLNEPQTLTIHHALRQSTDIVMGLLKSV